MEKSDILCLIYTIFVFFLLYLPIAHLVAFSFNDSMSVHYPWIKFTLDWYIGPITAVKAGFINDPMVMICLQNSLIQAAVTTLITIAVTIPTALALRKRFRGRNLIFYFLLLGMIYPGVTLGISNLLIFTQWLHVPLGLLTVSSTVAVYTIPFGLFLLMVRFDPMLARYEEAALTLGASAWKVFRTVTFPIIKLEVIVVALFAYTLAFGEIMRSFFVASVNFPVLPAFLYVEFGAHPPIPKFYALGSTITLISIVSILIIGLYMSRGGGLLRRSTVVSERA